MIVIADIFVTLPLSASRFPLTAGLSWNLSRKRKKAGAMPAF